MKKILFVVLVSLIATTSFSQSDYKKKPTLSINFMLNDFRTAERISNNSIAAVMRKRTWAQFKEMSPGLSVQYMQGLNDHVDFSATMGGSFADFVYKNQASTTGTNSFLLELDANVNVKLLSDRYKVNPFVSAGVGASSYKSSFGAYIPFGVGIQFKLSEGSFLFTNAQYRVGITDKTANHFNYSIGFAAPLFGTTE